MYMIHLKYIEIVFSCDLLQVKKFCLYSNTVDIKVLSMVIFTNNENFPLSTL